MMFARLVTCASRKVLLKYPYKTLQVTMSIAQCADDDNHHYHYEMDCAFVQCIQIDIRPFFSHFLGFQGFFSNQKLKPINILIITIIIVLIKTSQQKQFNELKSIQMKENKSKY